MELALLEQKKLYQARKGASLRYRLYLDEARGLLQVLPRIGGFTDTAFKDKCDKAIIAIENVLGDYLLDENYYNQKIEEILNS